jgi:catechol 2,3-dioxygenase-like lactoylglutathione lyase family enzyme
MPHVRRFDHVGITVANLDKVTAFFVGLGLEVEGTRTFVEGEFLDTVIGIPESRTEIVMLRPPDEGTRLELSSFVPPTISPDHPPQWPTTGAAQRGLRSRRPPGGCRPAGRGRLRACRRYRPIRAHLAHGLRARSRGDHRVPGRADRLTRLCRGIRDLIYTRRQQPRIPGAHNLLWINEAPLIGAAAQPAAWSDASLRQRPEEED